MHPRAKIAMIVAGLAATALAVPAAAQDDTEMTEGEQELAEILDGRIAGEPVNCLGSMHRDRVQTIDKTAFVFRDGDTVYVNRPRSARFIDDFDLPVFHQFGADLCRLDQVEMRDRTSGIPGPRVVLEEFVPYRKAQTEG
ncbi:hypothetical protein [Qipengyuania atrilutea]|uniref:Uncharacterized protein n=1 Tax=Qipengyuania atrilutea TaxID=2744473 RepID=A0A850H2I6_9SPHN|nr:hypothetical protein [Actirhodobacter atriluteus]NVD44896.1 hypothetical protein [Actirhodobacter atriluteus]